VITFPPANGNVPGTETLGGHTSRQLARLCEVVGLGRTDAEVYGQVLVGALVSVADRSMALPPPFESFLSDDHTPVEFSLSYQRGAPPALRVLLEPGSGADSLAENGRLGLGVIHDMADRWGFTTGQLDAVADLFFPPSPRGPLTVWCALELRPGGVPQLKVYLNPAAKKHLGVDDTGTVTIADLFPPESFGFYYDVVRPELLRTGTWSGELPVKTWRRRAALTARRRRGRGRRSA